MDELYREAYLNGKVTAVDTEFVPVTHEPVLMSYSWGRGVRRVVRAELVREFFGDWMVDRQTKIAYQNYKEDVETMGKLGLPEAELARSFYIDVMVAGVLRDETLLHHGLKAQMLHYLKWFRREYKQTFCYVPPGKKKPIVMDPRQVMDDLPPDALVGAVAKWGGAKDNHKIEERTADEWRQAMIDYAGDDAEGTQILGVDHRRYLKKTDYWDKYVAVDRPFTLTLMSCEASGAMIDQPILRKILRKQEIRIMRAEHCFRAAAGNPKLNMRSGPQMAKLLFHEWGWPEHPTVKTDSGGVSMDKEVLAWWLDRHKLQMARVKLAFNNASTLKGTFLEGILTGLSPDGRLRSDLNQIGAKTCMPAGELVLTNRGYLPVEYVRVGDQVITHERRARPVTKVIDNGKARVWRVELSNGLSLITTGNHPYLTNGGWIEASKLKPGVHYVTTHAHEREQWKTVRDWPAFEVSSWGRVRNRFTGNILALQKKETGGGRASYGHLKVTLVRNGAQTRGSDRKDFSVHRLVQEAFGVGPRKREVRHWDGIAWNNMAVNLAWATRKENAADMRDHGSGGGPRIYARAAVDLIRSTPHVRGGRGRRSSDLKLAKQLGMTRSNVSAIRLGRSWGSRIGQPKLTSFARAAVVSVEKLDVRQTYGLTVDDDHSHVTGGIVTHNSGRISSRKFDVMVEKTKVLKNGVVKNWVEKKKAGANVQNIPARKEKDPDGIRGSFRAPRVGETTAWGDRAEEQYKLIVADYSGFHLMLVIHFVSKLTSESAMLDIMKKYGTPSAVHVYTTIQMFKHTPPHYCDAYACKDKTGQWKKGHGENKSFSLKEFTMDDWKMVKPIFPDQYTYSKNCVTGETMILTEHGYERIDVLCAGAPLGRSKPIKPIRIATRDGLREVADLYRGGRQPVKKVTTELGFAVRANDSHDMPVVRAGKIEMVKVSDMKVGDLCVLKFGSSVHGDLTALPPMNQFGETSYKPLSLPATLTPEIARLLGYYVSEGYSVKSNMTFYTSFGFGRQDDDMIRDVEHCLRAVAGSRVRSAEDERSYRLYVTSKDLYDWWRWLRCGTSSADKQIPPCVLAAPWPIKREFLRAYFAGDGSVSKSSGAIKATSKSELLIRQLQGELINVGIACGVSSHENPEYGTYWSIQVSSKRYVARFAEIVGFSCERKQAAATDAEGRTDHSTLRLEGFEHELTTYQGRVVGDLRQRVGQCIRGVCKLGETLVRRLEQVDGFARTDAEKMVDDGLWTVRVTSIEPDGEEEVFDLYEPVHKMMVASGLLVGDTNFALIFLGSPWTLAYNTGRDANDEDQLEECKRHYDDWYELYPEIPVYQNHMIDHGYEHGWVPTIGGRRGHVQKMLEGCDRSGRYIQDEEKRKKMIKHGERVCTNTPAQGSEADIVKMALNLIRNSKKMKRLRVAPLFPVHDEVVSEGPGSTATEGLDEQIRLMKRPYRDLMDFELAVEGGIGENWILAKP